MLRPDGSSLASEAALADAAFEAMRRDNSFDRLFPAGKSPNGTFKTLPTTDVKNPGKKINRTRLEQLNREVLKSAAVDGASPSTKAGSLAKGRLGGDEPQAGMSSLGAPTNSRITAPTSTLTHPAKKDQPAPLRSSKLEQIFRAEVETAKLRNEKLMAKGEDPETKKFGKWALKVLQDSSFGPDTMDK